MTADETRLLLRQQLAARIAARIVAGKARLSSRLSPGAQRVYGWLDTRLFPAIVAYATHRLHIVALLGLGILLMLDGDSLVQLKAGNYTNVTSALVACIVLLQQVAHHHENKRLHSQHTSDLAALHAKLDALSASTTAQPTPDTPKRPRASSHASSRAASTTTTTPSAR